LIYLAMTVIGDLQEDYDTLLEKFRSGISDRMDSKDLKKFLKLYYIDLFQTHY